MRDDVQRLSEPGAHNRVTPVELFFDLVFVFAVTQLSHGLLADLTWQGLARYSVLLLAVWWVWMFTTWATNWLDPDKIPIRLMLFAMMLAGLVMSVAIPKAFGDHGLAFALAYVGMQVGRTVFAAWRLKPHNPSNFRNFQRISIWLAAAGLFWIAGAFFEANTRLVIWAVALAIEYVAPSLYFAVPGLGRSSLSDWRVDANHMAERCGLFVIIALGESILVTGATFAQKTPTVWTSAAFVTAFAGTVAMWWIYFNIGAERAARTFAKATETGALARAAYTYIHLPIVAGIVGCAVADEVVLAHPYGPTTWTYAVALLGGPAEYLLGNLLFKRATAGWTPLSHAAGIGVLLACFALVPVLPPLGIAVLATATLMGVAIWETRSLRSHAGS
jgi:low temperature requirement protein LtrA